MSAAGHGGLSPRALSRTHGGCYCTSMDYRSSVLSRAWQIHFPLLLYGAAVVQPKGLFPFLESERADEK